MAAGEPAAQCHAGLVERYEQLRRRVLNGEPDGFRLGLAVLQRQGLAAWLHAWEDLGPDHPPTSPPLDGCTGSAASDTVVAVLASMTLACAGLG